jgi:hypothetical protein
LSETMGGQPSIADEAETSIRYSNTWGHFIVDGCELVLTAWELTACRSELPAHHLSPHQYCQTFEAKRNKLANIHLQQELSLSCDSVEKAFAWSSFRLNVQIAPETKGSERLFWIIWKRPELTWKV